MNDNSSQILMRESTPNLNAVMTTACDGLVTIKQEPEDIVEEHLQLQTTVSTVPHVPQMTNRQMFSHYKRKFDLKGCSIRLEKCDKIWETLKVIKNLQFPSPSPTDNKDLVVAFKDVDHSQSKIAKPMQYQPSFINVNTSLPNFQFAIKSWKRLYTCTYCGKQYVDNRSLKAHLVKLHNVNPDPIVDVPPPREIPPLKEMPRLQEMPRLIEIPRPVPPPPPPPPAIRVKDIARSVEVPSPVIVQNEVVSQEDTPKPPKFTCQSCGVKYADARSLGGHSLRVHGILTDYHEKWLAQQENPNDYTVEDLLKRHPCNSCGKRYSCTKSLRIHYLREHNFVLPLMRGGRRRSFPTPFPTSTMAVTHSGDLQKHMNVCTICGKKYTKNWYLRVHCLEVHGIPMVCGKPKKNVAPTLRLIKEEPDAEEPEAPPEPVQHFPQDLPQGLSQETSFQVPNVKMEMSGTVGLKLLMGPAKRVIRMYQCSGCKKEFLSISKLRAHSLARHGIIIPRLRKPYKKAQKNQVVAETKQTLNPVKTEAKMVSTPRQVSLDRYFKSPLNGGNSINRASPLLNLPQNTIIRENILEKLPVKETMPALEKLPQIEKLPPKETYFPKESAPVALCPPKEKVDIIKCPLCSRNCKDIRKHYIAYHKIRYPETNIMKDSSIFPAEVGENASLVSEKAPSAPVVIRQSPKKKRRKLFSMPKRKKRRIEVVAPELLQTSVTEEAIQPMAVKSPVNQSQIKSAETPKMNINIKQDPSLKCPICGGFYANPRSLKIHRQKHKMKGETKQNIHLIKHNYKNMWKTAQPWDEKLNMSAFDESAMNLDTDADTGNESRTSESVTPSSTSESGDSNIRPVKSSRKSYNASETTCECGRGFRDPHTMFLHKDKCSIVQKLEREKTALARSSSDRDSGIGISITIKKKNDSYEIVSRESGDDDKSKDSSISKDSDQMSHSSDSTFSNSGFNDRKFLDLIPGECSKDHRLLKIEDADDDVDVDIEDDCQTLSNEFESKSVGEQISGTKDVINGKEEEANKDKSRTVDPLDMDLYRCATCLDLFKNKDDLMKHMVLHETRVLRQECPCGKTFRGAQSFLTHVEEYHPFWLQCGYCEVSFLSSKEYFSHSCQVKQAKKFEDLQEVICHYCSSKIRIINFDVHVKTHHSIPEKPYLCYYCKVRFSAKKYRASHLITDHTKPICKICGQTLRFDNIAKHEAYHEGLGFPCHICKKAFATMKHSNSHRLEVHVKEDVKCPVCSKICIRRRLHAHMRLHGLKEKCKICGKGFSNNNVLLNHIRTEHNSIYPFLKCDICNESFTSEKFLKKHFAQDVCKKANNFFVTKKVPRKAEKVDKKKDLERKGENTLKQTECPTNDEKHSENEESVEMDEPLALEASSDTENPSDMKDLADLNTNSQLEDDPGNLELQGTLEIKENSEAIEVLKTKEVAEAKTASAAKIIAESKEVLAEGKVVEGKDSGTKAIVEGKEDSEVKEVAEAEENSEAKEDSGAKEDAEATEDLEAKEDAETTEDSEAKKDAEATEDSGAKENSEAIEDSGAKEDAETTEDSEAKEDAETTEDSEAKEDAETTEDSEAKEDAEAKEDSEAIEDSGAKEDAEATEDAEAIEVSEVKEDAEAMEVSEAKEDAEETEDSEAKENSEKKEVVQQNGSLEAVEVSKPPEISESLETLEIEETSDPKESLNFDETMDSNETLDPMETSEMEKNVTTEMEDTEESFVSIEDSEEAVLDVITYTSEISGSTENSEEIEVES